MISSRGKEVEKRLVILDNPKHDYGKSLNGIDYDHATIDQFKRFNP